MQNVWKRNDAVELVILTKTFSNLFPEYVAV